MIRIGHLLDRCAGWEQRVGLCQLLDRLTPERFEQHPASIGPVNRTHFRTANCNIETLPSFGTWTPLAAPNVSRFVSKRQIDVIHAWGVEAASAARAASWKPVILHMFDPAIADRDGKRLLTLSHGGGLAVICSAERVRRRLLESGFPPDQTVVVRPGVDFSLISAFRRGSLREELGIAPQERVAIVAEPVTRGGGQFEAVHAATLYSHLNSGLKIIVPGNTPEVGRTCKFVRALPMPYPLVTPGDTYPFEQLVSIADILLLAPSAEVSTTALAWAMASGATVVGSAVYAVAELIASNVNGLLFIRKTDKNPQAAIVAHLRNHEAQARVAETARGQAYEVFGLRRYVEQTMKVYDNVLGGLPPGHGLTDSATITSNYG